jgi:hypothetical protein
LGVESICIVRIVHSRRGCNHRGCGVVTVLGGESVVCRYDLVHGEIGRSIGRLVEIFHVFLIRAGMTTPYDE